MVRERNGDSLPAVFKSGSQGDAFIRAPRARAPSLTRTKPVRKSFHAKFEMKRSITRGLFSLDGACTNWAEEFFSRMRRAEIGHHHHIAGHTCSGTPKRPHGAKITAASRTASKFRSFPATHLRTASPKSLPATGSVMSHSPLMYGLIKLHSRLEGDLQKQKESLGHVRAVIELVSPDFDVAQH